MMLCGVAFCAIAGALAAAPKKLDMFGAITVGVVTALGGGTLRDAMLGMRSFWVEDPSWVLVSVGAATATFFVARRVRFREGLMLLLDALGLAMFAIVGCQKALHLDLSYSVIVLMGVITGVAGGILRDLLCDEIPGVFKRGELYATAALMGCLAFIALIALGVSEHVSALVGVAVALAARLAALRWSIKLPIFKVREPKVVDDREVSSVDR